ncbi:M23 family metallopeptidase [Litchfieldia alkalitelluris]|uniref:M23 family metallopeptidase n=1 Tax=Litchfieldia alkalitelluris TaxID=304268 RepID=UPI000997286D|nr:M23 family metallopeptidase [Litchfieldia alkalitelluris]
MKFRLSGEYGELSPVRNWQPHTGIDLAMPEGTTLRAIKDGVVDRVYDGSGAIGKGLSIKFDDGSRGIYGHMNDVDVKVGEHVDFGSVLGASGSTGNSTGGHLHFGLKDSSGQFADPTPLADRLASISGDGVSEGIILKLMPDSVKESAKEKTLEIIYGTLDAIRDVVVELAGSIALVGGGVCILLYVAGWRDGLRWTGILSVANLLIKFLLGGYMA